MLPDDTLSHFSLDHLIGHITNSLEKARSENIRLPILIQGDWLKSQALLQRLTLLFPENAIARIDSSNATLNNFVNKNPNFVIGKEFSAAFIHLEDNSDPNLIAAIAGTVKGGGLFVITFSQLSGQLDKRSYFYDRITRILKNSLCIKISANTDGYSTCVQLPINQSLELHPENVFTEQEDAVCQILRTAKGRAHRPLVINAQRGRGKSAALGIACAELLNQERIEILVTAPALASATVLFKHFHQEVTLNQQLLRFIAPDDLVENLPDARLIIVDEAAALPTPVLKLILDNYSRVVFSTTTHGYEGSGQSFAIRFKQYLDQTTPDWKKLTLVKPIRWAAHDPLEPLVNQLFLLTTSLPDIVQQNLKYKDCDYQKLDCDQLTANETNLQNIFSLLQLAHYKTRPSDLKQLLDNPSYSLFIASHNNIIVGVVVGIDEGPLDSQMVSAIYQGKRRPSGELLPQSMIFHLEQAEASKKHYLRITRIAIHPDCQHKGIGTALLKFVENNCLNKYDYIGSSFGATPELLNFWLQQEYKLLRLGHTRKASSAMHAALVLKSLSQAEVPSLKTLQQRFLQDFEIHLSESLKTLEAETALAIFQSGSQIEIQYPTQNDWQTAYSYAFLNRNYEDCLHGLRVCCLFSLYNSKNTTMNYDFIIQKILQRLDWKSINKNFRFTGKHQAEMELKTKLAQLIIAHARPETKKILLANHLNKT